MKRSAFITWEQLKVGSIVLVGLAILAVAVYKVGTATGMFAKRYELIALLPNVSGLRVGGSVMVAGQLAGTVKQIDFLPVDYDTTKNLRVVMSIDRAIQEQVRSDSKARIRTMGLLGDKIVDINPGTPRYSVLRPGDTLRVAESLDYEQVLAQAAGAVDDVVGLTKDLKSITGGIVAGEGTMGQLMTNPTLYDQFTATLARTNSMLARFQSPTGTVGHLLDDPTLYYRLSNALASMDTLVRTVNSSQGTMGRLMRDTTLYVTFVSTVQNLDSLTRMMSTGDGAIQRLMKDPALYDEFSKFVHDANQMLADVRRDPRRYTRGMVQVKLF